MGDPRSGSGLREDVRKPEQRGDPNDDTERCVYAQDSGEGQEDENAEATACRASGPSGPGQKTQHRERAHREYRAENIAIASDLAESSMRLKKEHGAV